MIMKNFLIFNLICVLSMSLGSLVAQEAPTLPIEKLVDLEGNTVPEEAFSNDGKPLIISFWATWCAPCLKELANISTVYSQWQEEEGVKLIAISIDRARQLEKVKTLIAEKGWSYDVFMDQSGDFRNSLNVVNIPHTFVLDGKGEIIYQSTSYTPGDELKLYEKVKTAQSAN